MAPLLDTIDPNGLDEFSVVFTDRSLNSMSAAFQQVMRDISALLREVYIDAYLASAEKYRILRAEVESPEKAALAYREFVRAAVRRCVLEFKEFRNDAVDEMALAAGVSEADRADVVTYVREQIAGLHEGNVIRYRLKPDDLEGMKLR